MLPLAALLFLAQLSFAEDWPAWRGPSASGVSRSQSLPVQWSATENIAWTTPIPGRGHSSPIVVSGRIFLTTEIQGPKVDGAKPMKHVRNGEPYLHPDSVGGDHGYQLLVIAVDAQTGKVVWQRTAYQGTVADDRHKKNSYASPSAVSDGSVVIAYFESQGIYGYDFDGRLLWKHSFGQMGAWGLGAGASPVLFEDKVILVGDVDAGETSFIAALSKRDGKVLWKTPRRNRTTWNTPILVSTPKGPQIVVTGWESVISYDPRDGRKLWESAGVDGNAVPSAVAGHGMVFVACGYPVKRVYALRLDAADESERMAWRYDKGTAYVPSPILYGDLLYFMTDAGIMTALEARTGKVAYEGGRVPIPARFTASPVAFQDRLFITSEEGDTFVIKAGPRHEVLGKNSLGEQVFASPALVGDAIYIRAAGHLYRIQAKGSAP